MKAAAADRGSLPCLRRPSFMLFVRYQFGVDYLPDHFQNLRILHFPAAGDNDCIQIIK